MSHCSPHRSRPLHLLWIAIVTLPPAAACSALAGEPTTCNGLVYQEGGLTRAEYLPCAGDRGQAAEARATLRNVRSLMKKAGGRNLPERWDDRALTDLNTETTRRKCHRPTLRWC